jgi:arylsulfatase A-like enzyme
MTKFFMAFSIASLAMATVAAQTTTRPNIIVILTDDMGYGDLSCLGGIYPTPNIDRLASQGRIFTRYYSASPICSPSRTGLLTGNAPAKWRITSFLQKKADNRLCEQADFLAPEAPTLARSLKAVGYATAHFGKWHMGGGRDVDNAPPITAYGFDAYKSTWESPDPDPVVTATDWIWSDQDSIKRWNRTRYFVDQTLTFLERHKDTPCYINLWPDDMHTPWVGGDDATGKYPGGPEEEKSFIAVLQEYDRQIGRLIAGIQRLGMDNNTIVIFTSDNGPLPTFDGRRSLHMRGSKLSLYEAGIRMPFIVTWPARIQAGTTDSTSVLSATDLFASLCSVAGATMPRHSDGQDMSRVLEGTPATRRKDLYWEYGRNDKSFRYPAGRNRSPSLAMRAGKWKLLMNADGSHVELFDIDADPGETLNVAQANAATVKKLSKKLSTWWKELKK